ncbi:uncharacterized protein SRS1_16549 [Sporisorium reilianum f. sp. reilianum]|uniref:Uncharacterized protein n=1 Tax=Sporisorium reilianum f. sp. reilianum TaxID=72559 RepID=A0A2N8UCW8_9BASI|nr:uncharacterized protein SRS1_16549 [Sporisorium reilianum f. sp. reilianum]
MEPQVGATDFLLRETAKFQGKAYPLDIPFLRHTYSHDHGLAPVDFEHLRHGRTLRAGDWIFRPDPVMLDDVSSMIRSQMRRQQRRPEPVRKASGILQAQPAWPPVGFDPHFGRSLDMPSNIIDKHRATVIHEMQLHGNDLPIIYHLEVPTLPGMRHIMMTRVATPRHTDVPEASRKNGLLGAA